MNLILIDTAEVDARGEVCLRDARAVHIRDVLRAAAGSQLRVGVIDGGVGVAVVTSLDATSVVLRCDVSRPAPARPPIDLLLAVPRPKVLRRLWAQLAALGVGRVMLTNAARVERQYFDTHVLAPETYRPLLLEGLQQARDTRVPVVTIHRQFRVLVEDELDGLAPPGAPRLVAHPDVATSVHETARQAAGGRVLLAVGPEGGWNDFELSLLEAHGFRRVALGPRTLRVDTACVALLALVADALADRRLSADP